MHLSNKTISMSLFFNVEQFWAQKNLMVKAENICVLWTLRKLEITPQDMIALVVFEQYLNCSIQGVFIRMEIVKYKIANCA